MIPHKIMPDTCSTVSFIVQSITTVATNTSLIKY